MNFPNTTTILIAVLPVYLLLITGAVLRRTGVLKQEYDLGVMQVIYSVMIPCFILDRMLDAEILRNANIVLSGGLIGFSFILIGIGISYVFGKMLKFKDDTSLKSFALATGCQNFGFTAIPVIEIIWGSTAVAVLFVHNLGVEFAIWTLGVMLISSDKGIQWRRLINGPILAIGLGLFLMTTGLDPFVVGPVRKTISMIGVGAFPIAILMSGATIANLIFAEKPAYKILLGCVFIRLMVIPSVMILCAKWIPMAKELKEILLVQAAMPAGLSSILITRLYGGRAAVAVQVVIATTVVSIISLPYMITFGMRFLELKPNMP